VNECSEDDSLMLKIIEGYCMNRCATIPSSSSNCFIGNSCCAHPQQCPQRRSQDIGHTVGVVRRASSYPNEDIRPQLIVAEDEKIFVEEMEGDQLVMKERSLVDTVYALRDELTAFKRDFSSMTKNFENEQKARRRLEEKLRLQGADEMLNTSTISLQKRSPTTKENGVVLGEQ